jgi:hypothetical protein
MADVALRKGSPSRFARVRRELPPLSETAPWVTALLPDGSRYLRWTGAFDFLIAADGREIECHPLAPGSLKAFHTHLGPSISFALINLGFEPLHSTTLVVDGGAVALMGDCGYGKSSLGASFVQAGYRMLTDDLLVVTGHASHFTAYPGAPRVKLYPAIAKIIFGNDVDGLRLEHLTPKLIIPLDNGRAQRTPVPLKAIYMLTPPGARVAPRVTIRTLTQRRAFLELVRNTFNMSVSEPARLERQFAQAAQMAMNVPIKSLSYPRELRMLTDAREAILADLGGSGKQDPPYAVRRSAAAKK